MKKFFQLISIGLLVGAIVSQATPVKADMGLSGHGATNPSLPSSPDITYFMHECWRAGDGDPEWMIDEYLGDYPTQYYEEAYRACMEVVYQTGVYVANGKTWYKLPRYITITK